MAQRVDIALVRRQLVLSKYLRIMDCSIHPKR